MQYQKMFLIRVFWFELIFPIKFKIRIFNLMLLLKNSIPFKVQYYSSQFIIDSLSLEVPLNEMLTWWLPGCNVEAHPKMLY